MCRLPLLAMAVLLGFTGAGTAETCQDAVDRLADEYGLATATPPRPEAGQSRSAGAGAAQLSDKLAESGGVLEPPETGRTIVVEPPNEEAGRMPTAPDVAPEPPSRETEPGGLSAADRQQAEALLSAARAEAQRGDRERCFERLQEARVILRDSGG